MRLFRKVANDSSCISEERISSFLITSQSPVARLTYDRNRRQFKGIGFNYIEHEGVRYEAPSFKGLTVEKLSEAWQPQIERLIENRSLLEEGKPKRIPARSRYRRAGQRTQDSRAERGAPAIFSDIHRQTVRHGCQRVAAGQEGRRAVPHGMPVEVRTDAVEKLGDRS